MVMSDESLSALLASEPVVRCANHDDWVEWATRVVDAAREQEAADAAQPHVTPALSRWLRTVDDVATEQGAALFGRADSRTDAFACGAIWVAKAVALKGGAT